MTIWNDLAKHHEAIRTRRILGLFDDQKRFSEFSAGLDDLVFDYSKTNLDEAALDMLIQLAEEADLSADGQLRFPERVHGLQGEAVADELHVELPVAVA